MKFLRFLKTHKVISIGIPMIILVGIVSVGIYAQSQNFKSNKVTHDIQISKATPVETKQSALPVPATPPAVDQTQNTPTQPKTEPQTTPTASNPYTQGTSLAYVYDRRQEIGKPIGIWGNASLWRGAALREGLTIDQTPQPGDIVTRSGIQWVGFVDSVSGNSITYSMLSGDSKTTSISLLTAQDFQFIH